MLNLKFLLAVGVAIMGLGLVLPIIASTGNAESVDGKSFDVAQVQYCRSNELFRPRHPSADRYGCVKKKIVREDRRAVRQNIGVTAMESGHGVVPNKCDGRNSGGLCKGAFYVDIRFSRPFAERPHVLVSVESASHQGGCVGGATDKVVAYPSNITRRGFRLYAYGSPVAGSCGKSSSLASLAKAGWLAVGVE